MTIEKKISRSSLYQITRELLNSYNLYPKKRLGQNFLVDEKVLERIIFAADISDEDIVLEIGTGLGFLTNFLSKKSKFVITFDPDKDMIRISKDVFSSCQNIKFIDKSFLEWQPDSGFNKIVANVPYYITTPIIEKILKFQKKPGLIVLTVQKEVAERICAKPGSKTYGSFSVFVQNNALACIDSLVSKRSFYPSPDVESAILVLKPYSVPLYEIDEKLVRAAFSQRRKMLRSVLKSFNINFEKVGINPMLRAENLSLADFEALSRSF